MGICTLTEVKNYLKSNTDKEDDVLEQLIDACSAFFNTYCNRDFSAKAVTEYFNGGKRTFLLSQLPVDLTKTFQVWVDCDRVYAAGDLIDPEDYGLDPYTGILKLDIEAEEGFRAVKVSYTGGYAVYPADLRQACVELVSKKLREGTKGELGISQRTGPGGETILTLQDLVPQVKSVLDLYRLDVMV